MTQQFVKIIPLGDYQVLVMMEDDPNKGPTLIIMTQIDWIRAVAVHEYNSSEMRLIDFNSFERNRATRFLKDVSGGMGKKIYLPQEELPN